MSSDAAGDALFFKKLMFIPLAPESVSTKYAFASPVDREVNEYPATGVPPVARVDDAASVVKSPAAAAVPPIAGGEAK